MQKLPLDPEVSLRMTIFSLIPIGLVSDDRTSYGSEMDTDLVGAACFYTTFEKCVFIVRIFPYDPIVSDCVLSSRIDSYLRFISSFLYSEEFFSDCIPRFFGTSEDDSMIDFFDLARLEEVEERLEGFFIFCDHDTSTRVSVDTVHE